jgi:heme/copper-type cytochrome/quinol oxidase subunit 2
MLRRIHSLILCFLSVALLIGIKVLDLHFLVTILLVIPVTLVILISMLYFLIGKAPENTEHKSREQG